MPDNSNDASSPVLDTDNRKPEPGIGLCLSGGGYRAMLFHLGSLWRLNELAMLPKLKRISSVSGGSITSAQLGFKWAKLGWKNDRAEHFISEVVAPIRALAGKTLDEKSVIGGILHPGKTISGLIASAYSKHLYGNATLQDLPDDSTGLAPRFVINATSVQSGVLVRFSRPYLADYRVGRCDNPTVSLAAVVAASSAFPPVLSPARIKLPAGAIKASPGCSLNHEPYTTELVLTDGGVYDNLGLETVWKRYDTVLVSDGGGNYDPEANPATNWAQHALRINGLIDSQVRSLRKRQVVGALVRGERKGSYWRMRGNIKDYPATATLDCPAAATLALANVATRLKAMDDTLQERLINWGYAITDAGVRAHMGAPNDPPAQFPYPKSKV